MSFTSTPRCGMRHRSGFAEDVSDLMEPVEARQYSGRPAGAAYLKQNERYVTLILGTDQESVQQVSALMEK